ADGTVTYTPTASYTGADSFTYNASDGSLSSSVATVTLSVTAAPPPTTSGNLIVTNSALVSWSGTHLLTSDADATNDGTTIVPARVQTSTGAFVSNAS